MVFKTIDHGNLLSIYFENNIDSFQHPFQVLFHEKSCASDRKKIAPSFHDFHDLCFYRPTMNMQEIAKLKQDRTIYIYQVNCYAQVSLTIMQKLMLM